MFRGEFNQHLRLLQKYKNGSVGFLRLVKVRKSTVFIKALIAAVEKTHLS
jgi:hypothetical protein